MDLLSEALTGHKVYRITFPTGESIPFKLLSWEDFNAFTELSLKGTIPADILEDSVFRRCVLDSVIIDQMPDMYAGVISTVVALIMNLSGPADMSKFNEQMDEARSYIDTINSQTMMMICRAFPAYTPEDIMKMQWQTIKFRLAQAERILMSKNPPELVEPIRLLTAEELEKKEKHKPGMIDVDALIKEGKELEAFNSERPSNQEMSQARSEVAAKRQEMLKKYDNRQGGRRGRR